MFIKQGCKGHPGTIGMTRARDRLLAGCDPSSGKTIGTPAPSSFLNSCSIADVAPTPDLEGAALNEGWAFDLEVAGDSGGAQLQHDHVLGPSELTTDEVLTSRGVAISEYLARSEGLGGPRDSVLVSADEQSSSRSDSGGESD